MKKIYYLTAELNLAFWQKLCCFFIFFSFSVSAFAHPITLSTDATENKASESVPDSLSGHFDNLETATIYVSSGTIFHNSQEFQGNVEIIRQKKSAIAKKQKTVLLSKKIIRSQASKPKEEKYLPKAGFRQLPFESNTLFSSNGGKVVTVPTNNPQSKKLAILVQNHTYFFVPIRENHIPKYIMSFTNGTARWQTYIRPPPAVLSPALSEDEGAIALL